MALGRIRGTLATDKERQRQANSATSLIPALNCVWFIHFADAVAHRTQAGLSLINENADESSCDLHLTHLKQLP